MKIRHEQVGFTLIEVVVAAAIFGVIMSIVFPTLVQFLDTRDRLQTKHAELGGLQKAFLFMANDIRFAAARLGKDEYGEPLKTTLELGDNYLLEMTAVYPDVNMSGLGVPRRLRWVLEDGVLSRQQFPVLDPGSDSRNFTQTLLQEVERVDIEVSHIVDGRNNVDDQWREQSGLPDLFSVRIEMLDGREYRRVFNMLSAEVGLLEQLSPDDSQQEASGEAQQESSGDAQQVPPGFDPEPINRSDDAEP